MLKHEDNAVARINGNNLQPLAGVSVTVTDKETGLPAYLYADDGVTPLVQPLVTNDNGYYGFKAPDGTYLVTFSGQRIETFTREIVLDDPKDNPYATKADLAAGTGAALVTFTQNGAGAVSRRLDDKLRDTINALDFLSDAQKADAQARTYLLDLSAPLQAAIDYAASEGKALQLPRGGFKANLILRACSILRGSNWYPADWRVPAMATTNIRGSITVDQSVINQTYVWGLHVANLNIEGANVTGSRGLYIKNVTGGVFENIGISKFARGIEIENGMFNVYRFMNVSGCTEASYYLNGTALTTTQDFINCVARESPWGWIAESTATGYVTRTRLHCCKVESTTAGGLNFHRSCSVEVIGLDAENAPDGRATTSGTLLRLHKDGVDTSPFDSTAIITGGDLGGDNFNLQNAATAIDIGASKYVSLNGSVIRRATNGIRCSPTDTKANSVYLNSPQFVQVTNDYVTTSGKVVGIYPSTDLGGSPVASANFGLLTISGLADLSASTAGQIKFPATQNLSADPNTLDDYEEGQWTAGLTATTSGTITLQGGYSTGYYTKIGRQVTLTGVFVVASVSAPTGGLRLTGIPFANRTGTGADNCPSVSVRYMTGVTTESVEAIMQAGASQIEIALMANGSPVSMAAKIQAGTEIRVTASYFVS